MRFGPLGVAACLATTSCFSQLPRREAPASGASELPPRVPPAPGQARVYLDTTEGPTLVSERFPTGGESPVCQTPCYADLPPGTHVLRYRNLADPRYTESVALTVVEADRITGYRRALGFHDEKRLHKVVGIGGLYVGSTVALLGLMVWALGSLDDESNDAEAAGQIMLLSGGLLGGIGAYALLSGESVHQEGNGARWEFPLPASR